MHDQQIYELMAKTPKIRAVQIADILDQSLSDVSETLRALVADGDVVQSKSTAPNGCPAMVYDLSDEFKKTPQYAAIAENATAPTPPPVAPAPESSAAITTAPPAKPTAPAAPAQPASPTLGANINRTASGVAFILKKEGASDDELRAAMGLTSKDYPASYLRVAIGSGKVHKSGSLWYRGRATPLQPSPAHAQTPGASQQPEPALSAPPPEMITEAVGTERPIRIMPPESESYTTAPQPASPPAGVPKMRCGLWSDGMLELQADGKTIATLSKQEREFIAAFLNRIGEKLPATYQRPAPAPKI